MNTQQDKKQTDALTWQAAFEHDDAFAAFLEQAVKSERLPVFREVEAELTENLMGWCELDPRTLMKLLLSELQRPLDALNFSRIHSLSRDLLENAAPSDALRQLLRDVLQRLQPGLSLARLKQSMSQLRGLAAIAARPAIWISDFWTPHWVGQLMTAADVPAQEHEFFLEEGAIKLTCVWQPPFRKKPAFISLTWIADVNIRSKLYALLLRLDDPLHSLTEIALGNELRGDRIITSAELGFDPSREPWAVALVLRDENTPEKASDRDDSKVAD